MYVRYLAYLSTPGKDKKEVSRGELLESEPLMPEVGPHLYIIDILMDVGPIDLTWNDLKAWNEISQMELNIWEFQTVKRLANIYTSSFRE